MLNKDMSVYDGELFLDVVLFESFLGGVTGGA
jgi:hypothetical protein